MSSRIWTEEEIKILIRDYPDTKSEELAERLNRSLRAIYWRANLLGLKKSDEFLRSPECGRLYPGCGIGKETRFKKGQVSHNKGLKMSPDLREKVKHTWFKKGNVPHNTKHDGAITIRQKENDPPYKYIRISLGNWALLHRHNYEKKHGPIPKGMVLRCKDGNTLNCDADNWESITMDENLDKNSGRSDLTDNYVALRLFPQNKDLRDQVLQYPELIELKRTDLQLKNAINERTDKTAAND